MQKFNIKISDWQGYAPAYFANSWSSIGNKGMANSMTNIDLSDPNILTQGPGITALTDGTQAGSVSTLICSILKAPVSSDVAFACGGDKLYKITSSAVVATGGYPMSIDKGTVTGETATDIIAYQGNVYVFYNHSGSAGDIGQLTVSTDTLDPDWGSTVPTGKEALGSNPHYAIVGGDDIMYFTNGIYVGYYNGTTLETQGLDFHTDSQTNALTWDNNRVIIGVNRPNLTGSNFNQSAIYTWNGITSSWEGDPIEIPGKIGALYTKNGVKYVWYQDAVGTGAYVFGYISGLQVKPIMRYDGSLPTQTQVGELGGFLMWVSNNKVMLWGSADDNVPTKLFHYASGISATIGAIAAPFGDLLVSSYASTNYNIGKESGYSVASTYKTVVLPFAETKSKVSIDMIKVITEQMSTGAKLDITLEYDQGKSTKSLIQIAYSSANNIIHKILTKGVQCYDARLYLNWANGSTTNPVKVREIYLSGHLIDEY